MDEILECSPIELVNRINSIYTSCTSIEQHYLMQILKELADTGESQTYQNVWLADYKEIPVSIDTFIDHDMYLGKTNRNGAAVYPYWRKTLQNIFYAGNQYEECFFTGATRIGKSSTAITAIAYMLYRLMCLRDPQQYFGKKDVSKFSILFFNITKAAASSVGFREFNDTLRVSPWFNNHGTFSSSEQNFYYIPEGNKISIDFGSDAAHGLGKQVFVGFCLTENTKILTNIGPQTLLGLSMQSDVKVAQWTNNQIVYVNAQIRPTQKVNTTIQIRLADGTSIEGSSEHRLLMGDGTYKQLSEILPFDDIVGTKGNSEVIYWGKKCYDTTIQLYDVIDAKPSHNFLIVGNDDYYVSHNCDEMNFSHAGVKDVNKAKEHMANLYNTIAARVKGTFRMNGEVHGKIFAVSSKRSDSDFMEAYMQSQISAGAGEHMYIADAPQWEVLPKSMFRPEIFYIAVGDKHKRGFVVPDNQTFPEALEDLKNQGYKLMTPPIDMKPEFLADFEIALRDLAGISVPGTLSFITTATLQGCIDDTRRNPFYSDILQIGTQDTLTIEEFFHDNEVNPQWKLSPMYIHLDLSLNTDRTGISGVAITGRKDIEVDGKTISEPVYTHIFSVALEAPRGDKISYSKVKNFICWLRQKGFNIAGISRDQFQSEYLGQLLTESGFQVDLRSLDRTPDGYITFRSILLEKRLNMLHCQLLEDELIHLQRDSVTGKVDHPVGGCFTGDTKISLVDGRQLTILELMEEQQYKQNFVYTVNETTGHIEPKPIQKIFYTKSVKSLLHITFSDNTSVNCTSDHRFMLYDNTYLEAKYLTTGTYVKSKDNNIFVQSVLLFTTATTPVYDLTIQDNPNFALAAGVFVHNSKDCADSLAGALWNATLMNHGIPIPTKNVINAISNVNSGRMTNKPANSLASAMSRLYR